MSQRILKEVGAGSWSGTDEERDLLLAGFDYVSLRDDQSWAQDESLMPLVSLRELFRAVLGEYPDLDRTRESVVETLVDRLEDEEYNIAELPVALISKERLMVENVFSTIEMLVECGVFDEGKNIRVKSVEDGLKLSVQQKQVFLVSAFKQILHYRSASPWFPNFVNHLLGLDDKAYESEVAVLYRVLFPTSKATPESMARNWVKHWDYHRGCYFLWTARRLLEPRRAGFLWALAALECKLEVGDFVRADGTWRTEDLAKEVSAWFRDRCETPTAKLVAFKSNEDAKDAYFQLQADLVFGKALPSGDPQMQLIAVQKLINNFLWQIGDRDDSLKVALAGDGSTPKSKKDLKLLLPGGGGHEAWGYPGGRTKPRMVAELFRKGKAGTAKGKQVEVDNVVEKADSLDLTEDDIEDTQAASTQRTPRPRATTHISSAQQQKAVDLKAKEKEAASEVKEAVGLRLRQEGEDSDEDESEDDPDKLPLGEEVHVLDNREAELEAELRAVKRQKKALLSGNDVDEELEEGAQRQDECADKESGTGGMASDETGEEEEQANGGPNKAVGSKRKRASQAKGNFLNSLIKEVCASKAETQVGGLLQTLLAQTPPAVFHPMLVKTTLAVEVWFGKGKTVQPPPPGSQAETLSTLMEVVYNRPPVNAAIILAKGRGDNWIAEAGIAYGDAWSRLMSLEQAIFQVIEVADSLMTVRMTFHLGANGLGKKVTWPTALLNCVVAYPASMQSFLTPVGALLAAYNAKYRPTSHPIVAPRERARTPGTILNAAARPSIQRTSSSNGSGTPSAFSSTGKFSSLSSSSAGVGLFDGDEEVVERLSASASTPVRGTGDPTYAAVNSLPASSSQLSASNRWGMQYPNTRNLDQHLMFKRVETLVATAGQSRVRELTGTEQGGMLEPSNITVDNLLTNGSAMFLREHGGVSPAEQLAIFSHPDQELILSACLLEHIPANLMREGKKCVLLKHFLPKDNKGEIDSLELLVKAIRGVGYWLLYFLGWRNVVVNLLAELTDTRIFNRFSFRYFVQEFHNVMASIPARARLVTMPSEELDEDALNDFVAALAELKTKCDRNGSELLYETLPHVAVGGPGVDGLIGKSLAAPTALPPPPAVKAPSPVVPPAGRGDKSNNRGRSDSRGRDRDKDRGGKEDGRHRDGGHNKEGGSGKNGKGFDADRYCIADMMYSFRMTERSCSYRQCRRIHLTSVRGDVQNHPVARVIAQVEDSETLRAREAKELVGGVGPHVAEGRPLVRSAGGDQEQEGATVQGSTLEEAGARRRPGKGVKRRMRREAARARDLCCAPVVNNELALPIVISSEKSEGIAAGALSAAEEKGVAEATRIAMLFMTVLGPKSADGASSSPPLSSEAVASVLREATRAGAVTYGAREAQNWAEGFTFPPHAREDDARILKRFDFPADSEQNEMRLVKERASGFAALWEEKRKKNLATRLSPDRVKSMVGLPARLGYKLSAKSFATRYIQACNPTLPALQSPTDHLIHSQHLIELLRKTAAFDPDFYHRHVQGGRAMLRKCVAFKSNVKYEADWARWTIFFRQCFKNPTQEDLFMEELPRRTQVELLVAYGHYCLKEHRATPLAAQTITGSFSGLRHMFRINMIETDCFDHRSLKAFKTATRLEERRMAKDNQISKRKMPMTMTMVGKDTYRNSHTFAKSEAPAITPGPRAAVGLGGSIKPLLLRTGFRLSLIESTLGVQEDLLG
eukprot:gene21809-27878_t